MIVVYETEVTMDLRQRRSILSSEPNPDQRLDYVVCLQAPLEASISESPIEARLRYVPDRVILRPESLNDYLEQTGALDWSSLEELAVTILNDINDELIARWIEITIILDTDNTHHDVVLEERQPQWQGHDILSRLSTA